MKHVRTKGWHVLSSRLTKFPRMNPDARWQQRRIPQCPHGRNPDHRGNYSSWTCSLETADFFQINLMMSLWTCSHSDSLGLVVKTNSFSSTAPCARTVTCSCVVGCLEFSWCQGRFEKTAFATRLPFLGRPAPPQELGRSHLELKNKRHWKTRPQHYRHINSSWKWVETIQATVCMQRFEKKNVFCFHYSWFQFKTKIICPFIAGNVSNIFLEKRIQTSA